MTCKETLQAKTPYTPPFTHCTCLQYTYSHREGVGGGGEEHHAQFTKLGRKYEHD
jgi:hypothetical protein